jgi:hypothetical protein
MIDAVQRARQIAKNVLGGQHDPLLACREIADIREQLLAVADDVMDVFVAVASEVDGIPLGPERSYWNIEALRKKDLDAAEYRAQVRSIVADALRALLEATRHESHPD